MRSVGHLWPNHDQRAPRAWFPSSGGGAGWPGACRTIDQIAMSAVSVCRVTLRIFTSRCSYAVACVVVYVVRTVIRALDAEPDAVVLCEDKAVGVAPVAEALVRF